MSHRHSILCRRNLRAYAAAFISYLMLAGQLAPLALGSAPPRPLPAPAAATAPATAKAAPAAAALPFAAPIITATKVDAFPDPNGNSKAEPGDTITYTVEIKNTGDADATGVTFTDNVDTNTSLVAGSVNTQPITDPDAYTASGNIPISLAAPGVLDNDRDPDPGDTLVVTEVQGAAGNVGVATDTTAAGRGGVKGSVTLNSDGSFTYEPPPGFEGEDTFTYKAGDGTTTDAATTVTITISGMAWFIQTGGGGSNRGTFSNPFLSIASFNTANAGTGAVPDPKTGDFIALRSGSYSEADGINLRAQQKLIGAAVAFGTVFTADANSSSAYTTFAGAAGAAPTIAASAGNGVDLSTDNTVRGLNVANTSGFDINGAAVGSPVINTVNLTGTGGALNVSTSGAFGANVTFNTLESTSSTGANLNLVGVTGTLGITDGGAGLSGSAAASPAVNVSGGSVSFTYPDNVSKTAGTGALVNVSGGHAGTLTFNTGTVSATAGAGLQFDNADGAYNFNGTTTLNGGDAGVDILNGSGGTFNFSASTSITSPTGTAFNVNTGAPNVTYSGTILDNTAGQRAVNIDGTTGGSIGINSVTAASVAGGVGNTGVNINNAAGSVTFTTLNLGAAGTRMSQTAVTITGGTGAVGLGTATIFTTGAAQGIVGTNGAGSITTGSGSVVDTAGAAAVNIDGPAGRTPLNMQFTRINASGGSNGVSLTDTSATGSPGGFRVLGAASGSDRCGGFIDTVPAVDTIIAPVPGECTGGRITATTGAGDGTPTDNAGIGVRLVNANSVVLQRVRVDGHSNMAIYGNNVNGFTLTNSLVDGTNGDDAATDDNAITFDNLLGSASISASSISGGHEDNLDVENSTGTLDRLTITNSDFGTQSTAFGEDALVFSSTGNPTMKLTVDSCRFRHGRSDLLQSVARDTSTLETIIRNSIFDNDHPNTLSGGGGIVVEADAAGDAPNHTFNISNNTFRDALGVAVNVFKGPGTGTMSGTISGNVIGVNGVLDSGSAQGSGINVDGDGNGAVTVAITNNTIRQYGSGDGIHLNAGNSEAGGNPGDVTLNATVSGNLVEQPGTFGSNALELNGGTNTGNSNQICLDVLNNTMENGGKTSAFEDDINIRQRFDSVVRMPGYTGAAKDPTAVQNYIAARNPGAETVIASASGNPAPSGFFNTVPAGSACPTAAAPSGPETFDSGAIAPVGSGGVQAASAPAAPATVGAPAGNVTSRPFVSFPRGTSAPKAAAPATKRAGGSTFRHTAEGVSAPLYTEPVAQRKKTTPRAPVLSDTPVGPSGAGGTVSVNIGTLRQTDSVIITFQVTVDNPYSGPPNVSNQGTVSGTNFSNVLTDDPSEAGANNPTLTPINVVNINVNDAKQSEPASGESKMLFVVALSAPPSSAVSVQYATTDGTATGGATCDGAADYVTAGGTLNLGVGQQTGIIEVTVCADNTGGESDETLTLTLSNATGGTIQDGTATGTITQGSAAGAFIISELRTFGPGGSNDPNDEFVELYNNTDTPLTVAASDISAGYGVYAMGADCNAAPVLLGVIPNGTVIPARGHYLLTGSAYSLANYGGTGAAAGNLTMAADIPSNGNVGVFSTGNVLSVSSANRLDAVGFGTNTGGVCSLLSEGTTLPPAATNQTALGQYTYFRTECGFVQGQNCTAGGNPKDSNDNAADFLFADPNGTDAGAGERNGAAGPQNLASPIRRDTSGISAPLLDGSVSSSAPPNRVRDVTNDPVNNSSFGTLSIRRRVQNNTGGPVTRLRFRIVEMTTFSSTDPGAADLRARTAPATVTVMSINDPTTCAATGTPTTAPCSAPVLGTTLEEPPTQPGGGGYNSTLAAGTITAATPLANGASINVQFLLGVQKQGRFRFFIIIEALP